MRCQNRCWQRNCDAPSHVVSRCGKGDSWTNSWTRRRANAVWRVADVVADSVRQVERPLRTRIDRIAQRREPVVGAVASEVAGVQLLDHDGGAPRREREIPVEPREVEV